MAGLSGTPIDRHDCTIVPAARHERYGPRSSRIVHRRAIAIR
jgi:hypothetical protein